MVQTTLGQIAANRKQRKHLATRIAVAVLVLTCAVPAQCAAKRAKRPEYNLQPGQAFGYSVKVEVREPRRTTYYVGYALFAVSAIQDGRASLVTAIPIVSAKTPDATPSVPAEFKTDKVYLGGTYPGIRVEKNSLPYLPGSVVEHIFTRLPPEVSRRQWSDRTELRSYYLGGKSGSGSHPGYQEWSYEVIGNSLRIGETFERRIGKDEDQPVEAWSGTGEIELDPQRRLIKRREFSMTYTTRSAGRPRRVQVNLTTGLLDEISLLAAARDVSVRLPGTLPSQHERDAFQTTDPSGRRVHTDTWFKDGDRLLLPDAQKAHAVQVVGPLRDGKICYRRDGSRAFWDGYLPPTDFQFLPGKAVYSSKKAEFIQADARDGLLRQLNSGDSKEAQKAFETLARLRPDTPDDEIAMALGQWVSRADWIFGPALSKAMKQWATPKVVPVLVDAMQKTDPVTKSITRNGITTVGAPAEQHVAKLLRHEATEVRESACHLLGIIGTPSVLRELGTLKHRDPERSVRSKAGSAISAIRKRHGLDKR